jgi:hypothetical protein
MNETLNLGMDFCNNNSGFMLVALASIGLTVHALVARRASRQIAKNEEAEAAPVEVKPPTNQEKIAKHITDALKLPLSNWFLDPAAPKRARCNHPDFQLVSFSYDGGVLFYIKDTHVSSNSVSFDDDAHYSLARQLFSDLTKQETENKLASIVKTIAAKQDQPTENGMLVFEAFKKALSQPDKWAQHGANDTYMACNGCGTSGLGFRLYAKNNCDVYVANISLRSLLTSEQITELASMMKPIMDNCKTYQAQVANAMKILASITNA